jgi:Uma2 family endonuclease
MTPTTLPLPTPLILDLDLTDDQFFQLCQNHRDLKFERTAAGELIIMSPTGGNTGKRNVKLTTQLDLWNTRTQLGEVFDSSTGFTLPNGADRSPDAAWVRKRSLASPHPRAARPVCAPVSRFCGRVDVA